MAKIPRGAKGRSIDTLKTRTDSLKRIGKDKANSGSRSGWSGMKMEAAATDRALKGAQKLPDYRPKKKK